MGNQNQFTEKLLKLLVEIIMSDKGIQAMLIKNMKLH